MLTEQFEAHVYGQSALILLTLARHIAGRFNYDFVGTEHLLLAITEVKDGTAIKVLKNLGHEPEVISHKVLKIMDTNRPPRDPLKIHFTPRVKYILKLAAKEAERMNHPLICTEHILLGLLREKETCGQEGCAARILKELGVDIDMVRQEILRLDHNAEIQEALLRSVENIDTFSGLYDSALALFRITGAGVPDEVRDLIRRARIILLKEIAESKKLPPGLPEILLTFVQRRVQPELEDAPMLEALGAAMKRIGLGATS